GQRSCACVVKYRYMKKILKKYVLPFIFLWVIYILVAQLNFVTSEFLLDCFYPNLSDFTISAISIVIFLSWFCLKKRKELKNGKQWLREHINVVIVVIIFILLLLVFQDYLLLVQHPYIIFSSDGIDFLWGTIESKTNQKDKIKETKDLFKNHNIEILGIKDYTEDSNGNGVSDHIVIELEMYVPLDYDYFIDVGDLVSNDYHEEYIKHNYNRYGYVVGPTTVLLNDRGTEWARQRMTWFEMETEMVNVVKLKYSNIPSFAEKLEGYAGSFHLCGFEFKTYGDVGIEYFKNDNCYVTGEYNLADFEKIDLW
ncbi:hypothetical protein ACFLY5_00830, partial [Patescibacteria group bacterium]